MANKTALRNFWRKATPDERAWVAAQADTSVAYLYQQLKPSTRRRINVVMAQAIEKATRKLNQDNGGVTPIVTCADLAAMYRGMQND